MLYAIIGMSSLFVAIGFIVTENNAKYLLSGYNTMNEAEREEFDINAFISYFRKFHIFLGISILVFGLGLTIFINPNIGGIFLGIYPLFAYSFLVWKNFKYSKGMSTKKNKISIFILVGTLIFVIGIFFFGFKEVKLTVVDNRIELQGTYGEEISQADIKSIELIDQLPGITLKTNGFALGTTRKGYFKTKNGEIVKLILNSDNKPYILITKKNGDKIYFSSKEKSNKGLYNEIKEKLPNIVLN